MVAAVGKSDFQILAHLAEQFAGGLLSQFGGCVAELFAEGISEVTVAGEAQIERQASEISVLVRQSLQ